MSMSQRKRAKSTSAWGDGPEPADHDFLQRLYGKWDSSHEGSLTLQNIVNGLAKLKGTTDIMNSMSMFFDLYDEEGNGKVDREGILRMSESLLFLSRRGFDGALTPTESMNGISPISPEGSNVVKTSINEKFLGSVSAFIRRCFEYADPDEPEADTADVAASKLDSFAIGDDEDDKSEDLLELTETKSHTKSPVRSKPAATDPLSEITPPNSPPTTGKTTASTRATSHNLALDPTKPLHITLPTFRMVILADELLEQFFETFFPQSFRLAEPVNASSTSLPSTNTLSGNLTTFTNLGAPVKNLISSASNKTVVDIGSVGGVVEPGSRGLRGVLDNIVNDGMRMAGEMRKQFEESQREFEKNARAQGQRYRDDDDEDDDEDERGDRRDQDLLEGAEVQSLRQPTRENSALSDGSATRDGGNSGDVSLLDMETADKKVEFDAK